jgi:predicted N-acyltransferase
LSTTPFLSLPEAALSAGRRGARAATRYRTVVVNSIRDIDATRWDELSGPGAVIRSHAYLDAVEQSGINDCRYYYPVVYNQNDEMVAHACVYTISTDLSQLLPARLQRWVAGLRRVWPRFLSVRITECASPLVAGHGISMRAGEDPTALLRELESTINAIARSANSGLIVIRDFLTEERDGTDDLLRQGYALRMNMPLARITVRWASYEDYLASMRARYRKDVKRRLQRSLANGQHVQRLHQFGEHAETWAAQAQLVLARAQRFKRERLGPAYYVNMDSKLDEQSLMLVACRDGRMVAHGMVLTDRENTIATFFGREAGRPSAEWFSLMNEVIKLGIERQSRYIHLGLGSYDAKSLVGAEVEPLYLYCRTRFAPLNWLIRLLPEMMGLRGKAHKRIFHD